MKLPLNQLLSNRTRHGANCSKQCCFWFWAMLNVMTFWFQDRRQQKKKKQMLASLICESEDATNLQCSQLLRLDEIFLPVAYINLLWNNSYEIWLMASITGPGSIAKALQVQGGCQLEVMEIRFFITNMLLSPCKPSSLASCWSLIIQDLLPCQGQGLMPHIVEPLLKDTPQQRISML